MQLEDILSNCRDQDRGREMELVNPFNGEPTGLKFTVVGLDSETAHRARLALGDELADLADGDGRVSSANREIARLHCLAAHVVRWDVSEDGKPLAFTAKNIEILLRVPWIGAQVDAFASDRRNFASADVELWSKI